MRVVERSEQEEHFSEGEPDLEPPEELAIGELDDETMLEEDLDSEVVLEEDVEEDVLEATLEDLVHVDDEDEVDDSAGDAVAQAGTELDEADEMDLDALDIADVEESLDRILHERLAELAVQPDDDGDGEESGAAGGGLLLHELTTVAPCRADEFVCRGCFLVRSRVQLADAGAMLCRDCAV